MTKIKLCGLRREEDIACVNELLPEYIGFVFCKKSKRYVPVEQAGELRRQLDKRIIPVGVFVDEKPEVIAALVKAHVIDAVQLHGNEDEDEIRTLRSLTDCMIIKAFQIKDQEDIRAVNDSSADCVLVDSGGGTGETFQWSLASEIKRPCFLAGGLTPENVKTAIDELHPFAVDASSSLETAGFKDKEKMAAFVNAVRQRKD